MRLIQRVNPGGMQLENCLKRFRVADRRGETLMSKIENFILCSVFILSCIVFSACSTLKHVEETDKWDCSVACAEASDKDSYIITYSDAIIISKTGVLSFQNQNDFDIVIHLLTNGQQERIAEVAAGGVTVLYQIAEETEYTVGCHADAAEGTKIKLMVYDGENADTFVY